MVNRYVIAAVAIGLGLAAANSADAYQKITKTRVSPSGVRVVTETVDTETGEVTEHDPAELHRPRTLDSETPTKPTKPKSVDELIEKKDFYEAFDLARSSYLTEARKNEKASKKTTYLKATWAYIEKRIADNKGFASCKEAEKLRTVIRDGVEDLNVFLFFMYYKQFCGTELFTKEERRGFVKKAIKMNPKKARAFLNKYVGGSENY